MRQGGREREAETETETDREIKTAESVAGLCALMNISENSLENACAGVSFLIKLFAKDLQLHFKERLQHKCCHVNFAKSRTPI